MRRDWKFWWLGISLVLLLMALSHALTRANADSATDTVQRNVRHGRYWLASYNAALDMHEAAVPLDVYPVGTRLLLTYHHRQVRVHSIAGGCQCFDISDEAMNRLADTSQGTIRVYAERIRRQ